MGVLVVKPQFLFIILSRDYSLFHSLFYFINQDIAKSIATLATLAVRIAINVKTCLI